MIRIALHAALFAVLFAAAACGSDGPSASTSTPTAAPTAAHTPTAPPSPVAPTATPAAETLGAAIFADYAAMLDEAAGFLTAAASPEEIAPKVADLKERYIERFVAYGWEREKLGEADKGAVDAVVSRLLVQGPVNFQPLADAVTRLQALGTDEGREVGNTVASLNTLTQYAFFELLRKQLPAEADRLGVP